MKKALLIIILGIFVLMAFGIDAYAAKKAAKSKIPAEDIQAMSDTIDNLTRKVYGNALLSPDDNRDLINVKIKLDNQMLVAPDIVLAPLYYKAGCIYKLREMNTEAIECFQTILENFADTALAPKARANLKAMGVEVAEVEDKTDEEEEDE
ncbi:hypothetical protein IJ818_06655 [bacterium]|nr:hypothetical protein [bacterium]